MEVLSRGFQECLARLTRWDDLADDVLRDAGGDPLTLLEPASFAV